MRLKNKILLLILIASFTRGISQNYSVNIGMIDHCPDKVVVLPVNVNNFFNIGAITLYISYDTAILEFDTIINVNSQTPGVISNTIHDTLSTIGIAWYASTTLPSNIGTGKFLDIRFLYKRGDANLVFKSGCEVADISANILSVSFNNGYIHEDSIPQIIESPADTIVIIGQPTSFQTKTLQNASYQWQQSTDNGLSWLDLTISSNYPNVTNDTLFIHNSQASMHGNLYRCKAFFQCDTFSGSALLSVDTTSALIKNNIFHSQVTIYPNPVNNKLCINLNSFEGLVKIDLFSSHGSHVAKFLNEVLPSGNIKTTFETHLIKPGIYFLRIQLLKDNKVYFVQKKIIKMI